MATIEWASLTEGKDGFLAVLLVREETSAENRAFSTLCAIHPTSEGAKEKALKLAQQLGAEERVAWESRQEDVRYKRMSQAERIAFSGLPTPKEEKRGGRRTTERAPTLREASAFGVPFVR